MERNEVYKLIDGERDYQAEKWGEVNHSPAEYLVYMQDYLTEAFNHAARLGEPISTKKVLADIRKISAMGIACMELHGAPERSDNY